MDGNKRKQIKDGTRYVGMRTFLLLLLLLVFILFFLSLFFSFLSDSKRKPSLAILWEYVVIQ